MHKIRERHLMAVVCILLYWLPVFDQTANSGTLAFLRAALGEGLVLFQYSFLVAAVLLATLPMKSWQMASCSLPQFFYTYVALDYWLHHPGAPYQAFAAHACMSLVFIYCIYTRYHGYFMGHKDDRRTVNKNS